jgi:hypothetical protein
MAGCCAGGPAGTGPPAAVDAAASVPAAAAGRLLWRGVWAPRPAGAVSDSVSASSRLRLGSLRRLRQWRPVRLQPARGDDGYAGSAGRRGEAAHATAATKRRQQRARLGCSGGVEMAAPASERRHELADEAIRAALGRREGGPRRVRRRAAGALRQPHRSRQRGGCGIIPDAGAEGERVRQAEVVAGDADFTCRPGLAGLLRRCSRIGMAASRAAAVVHLPVPLQHTRTRRLRRVKRLR